MLPTSAFLQRILLQHTFLLFSHLDTAAIILSSHRTLISSSTGKPARHRPPLPASFPPASCCAAEGVAAPPLAPEQAAREAAIAERSERSGSGDWANCRQASGCRQEV